jgi:hypothetical protein
MLLKIFLCVVVLIAVFALAVATRPADFRIKRSAIIPAPPAVVFAQVNDFHNWEAWSPWAKMDPNAKSDFDGPTSGVGSKFHWDGNSQVGEGNMTIAESRPNDLVKIDLEFIKPFAAKNLAEFNFTPVGDGTELTWTMTGKNNFMGKAFSLFVNCDKMVGGQFEQGLANIKSVVESAK